MRNLLTGVIIILAVILGIFLYNNFNQEEEELIESSKLIEQQIKNVGKLVVTEGNFSQVFTFKNNKKFYLDVFSAQKKALVIVNAEVSIAYDLRKIKTEIDETNKVVRITNIPEAEIKINPNIEYYDVTQDYLNQFDEKDYNKIKKHVMASMKKKIENSSIKSNAHNRLISELQQIFILTKSLGWSLEYNGNTVITEEALQQLKL